MKKRLRTLLPIAIILLMVAIGFYRYWPVGAPLPNSSQFTLSIGNVDKTLPAGDTFSVTARLRNASGRSYNITAANQVIYIDFYKANEDKPAELEFDDYRHHRLFAGIDIKEKRSFTPTEPGDYLLHVYAKFTIWGEDDKKTYTCDMGHIPIQVTS